MAGISCLIFDAGDLLYYRRKNSLDMLRSAIRDIIGSDVDIPRDRVLLFYELRELSYRGIISRRERIFLFLKSLGVDKRFSESIYRVYDRMLQDTIVFYGDVPETLKKLREKGYRLAVLSDSDYSAAEKKVWFRRVGIANLFDVIVCSCDIGYCKPEAEAYLTVLNLLEADPGDTVFIGHSVKDLVGAKKVGLKTIALRCPIRDNKISATYIEAFNELPKVIGRLE